MFSRRKKLKPGQGGEIHITDSIKRLIKEGNKFIGEIQQVPPLASAVKVNGISAYKLHRENKKITLKSKKVSLIQIKILKSFHNKTFFEIECGKGFYVRSFARDLAISLGTFGHVNTLKRTKVGKFLLDSAILLDDLLKKGKRLQEFNCIHSSISMLDDILACEIEEKEKLLSLSLGKSINVDLNELIDPPLNSFDNNFLFLSNKGNIISYGKLNGNLFKPKKILI